jgi:hypothetical protein
MPGGSAVLPQYEQEYSASWDCSMTADHSMLWSG